MKKAANLIISLAFALSIAQAHATQVWNATIKVLDESAQPVAGAHAEMWWYVNTPDGNTSSDKVEGLTDSNGVFKAKHQANGSISLSFAADKAGCYSMQTGRELYKYKDNDPEKWNPHISMILKKINRPVAMYAKQIDSLKVPRFNKSIGYDLAIGDWIAPYGKGVNADLFFTETHTTPQSGYILSVSFPNSGDGIQEFSVPNNEKGSALRSSQKAPADGYQPTISQTQTTNPNRNFYIRVHTKLDENGNVVSARYGKIYGDLAQFTYYYNPVPNDRDVEFDSKQNLIHELGPLQQVTAP